MNSDPLSNSAKVCALLVCVCLLPLAALPVEAASPGLGQALQSGAPLSWEGFWNGLVSHLEDFWNYEITSVDGRSITVRMTVIGLILLALGIAAAHLFSRLVVRRFLLNLGLNEHVAAAIQALVYYLLIVTFGLIALRLVNVPLTAFAILGGALAIGVGFGSQNIMNNFISGLILLAERPIRIGDLIQVDELYGIVEHIGARSTRVRSSENVDIIVPNSAFLEKNVINWTLSDDRYRASIHVGVAYGSPTDQVAELLRQAVEGHERVLKSPAPIILFAAFGDNSLHFEAHFWIRMKRLMDRRIISSELRHKVNQLFSEAGITIAFPQRDVHLDSLKPIEVRVMGEEKE